MRHIQQAIVTAISTIQPPVKSLLDIGCGDGEFTYYLSNRFRLKTTIGIDPLIASQRTDSKAIQFVTGYVESLPFASESFDIVIACQSMHHWNNTTDGINEAFRVLKRNGVLIIGDPLLIGWMSNRFSSWLVQKIDGGHFSEQNSLLECLAKAGFISTSISLVPKTYKSLYLITAVKPSA